MGKTKANEEDDRSEDSSTPSSTKFGSRFREDDPYLLARLHKTDTKVEVNKTKPVGDQVKDILANCKKALAEDPISRSVIRERLV